MKKTFVYILLFISLIAFFYCRKDRANDKNMDVSSHSILLRFQPEVGKQHFYHIDIDTKMDMGIIDMDIDMDMGMDISSIVSRQLSNDMNEVQLTIDRCIIKLPFGLKYNSDDDNIDPKLSGIHEVFDEFIDKPITININSQGQLQHDIAWETRMKKNDRIPKNVQIQEIIRMLYIPYPKEKISTGSSWEYKNHVDTELGKIELQMDYTLSSITENIVVIDMKGTSTKVNGINLNATGKMRVEKKTGEMINLDLQQKSSIELENHKVNMNMYLKIQRKM